MVQNHSQQVVTATTCLTNFQADRNKRAQELNQADLGDDIEPRTRTMLCCCWLKVIWLCFLSVRSVPDCVSLKSHLGSLCMYVTMYHFSILEEVVSFTCMERIGIGSACSRGFALRIACWKFEFTAKLRV
jgi:hypothetical protein